MISDSLRRIPLFAGLPDSDLTWLSERAEAMTLEAGTNLIDEGQPGDAAYIVLDGEFEVIKKSNRQDIVISVREGGEVFGEMALIDRSPRTATVRAARRSNVLKIGGDTFRQLLAHSPSASLSILQTVTQRLRQNDALLRQNEKMAALGTLAAGLAHELNNPAAAVRRSADQLRVALDNWTTSSAELQHLALSPAQLQLVDGLKARLSSRQGTTALDALEQNDREYEVQSWLEGHGLTDAWQLAPTLVADGWSPANLSKMEADFPSPALSPMIRWLANGLIVYSLLDELDLGAGRVSEIVKAVKAYSYLDQAPIQEVDVHEGLENTLVILRHKLSGIQITRDYAADLPHIEAHGSELNQVWTNILDNAAYAMEGRGSLQIRTHAEDGQVTVEIQDSGPGIPPEIQQRIFEPFYTTKPPGVGTGLGLHIVYSIINNHYGRIRVTSQPGNTCFEVTLPVKLPH
jgi:signal transduction histidine kinase